MSSSSNSLLLSGKSSWIHSSTVVVIAAWGLLCSLKSSSSTPSPLPKQNFFPSQNTGRIMYPQTPLFHLRLTNPTLTCLHHHLILSWLNCKNPHLPRSAFSPPPQHWTEIASLTQRNHPSVNKKGTIIPVPKWSIALLPKPLSEFVLLYLNENLMLVLSVELWKPSKQCPRLTCNWLKVSSVTMSERHGHLTSPKKKHVESIHASF